MNFFNKYFSSAQDFLEHYSSWKTNNETLVFTNGCFDILHPGHAQYLYDARQLGTKLIVGLNSDASVKRQNKGEERPLQNHEARAKLLCSFFFVDAVILFNDDTPLALIDGVKPDVLVKGADYSVSANKGDKLHIVGKEEVLSWNGKVETISFLEGYSTSSIVNKIKGENGKN
jgi:rfaE bifunctional protein nucleotidyltransferase chain/domain